MSKKFDSEDLCDCILQIMTNGDALNNKIAAVDAEKTTVLDPVLKPIDSAAYYLQAWTNKILNTSPSIFYGIEEVQAADGGGAVAKTYKVFVEVVLVDSGQSNDTDRRIARYSRALEELFSENFGKAIAASTIKVDSVRPISFKLELDSDDEIKVGGVSLTITLV